MRTPRLHVDATLQEGARLALPAEAAHYLSRVLRLAPGAALIVFDGRGTEHAAILAELSAKSAVAELGERSTTVRESPLRITLIQGLSRGHRMDYCVQKATELGVERIVAARMDRSVVRLDPRKVDKRVAHWRGIAVSACEQSGRAAVPTIECVADLDRALACARGQLVMLDARGEGSHRWRCDDQALTLCVGPEGGYGDDERTRLRAAGAARWSLGPRILRTETAGLVAMALAQARWGDLA